MGNLALDANKVKVKALVAMLGLTTPLTTDLSLPALPTISEELGVPFAESNLIILCFFAFLAVSMVVMGPLGDRIGRKRILLASLSVYAIGNMACSFAPGIATLVVMRSVSACGAGGMLSTSTALVKDFFDGKEMNEVLALIQTLGVLGPLLAPTLGAFLLKWVSWRASFALLAVFGVAGIALGATIRIPAFPARAGADMSPKRAILLFGKLLRNFRFSGQLVASGLATACFMLYLAMSSYIYIVDFGVSEVAYGAFFSIAALGSLVGPQVYLKTVGKMPARRIYLACFGAIFAAGIGMVIAGGTSPIMFLFTYLPMPIAYSCMRPLSVGMLLSEADADAGVLSSLINFGLYCIGLAGIALGSLAWPNRVAVMGVASAALAFAGSLMIALSLKEKCSDAERQ